MLNFLRDDLLQYNDVIIIDFNARVSANVNCIQSDFLSIIATQLSQYHTGMKSVVKDYMEDLNVLARDTIWSKVLGIIHINDATDSREKIQKAVAALNKKIVILIDDLDRLTGEEILEVLKLLSLIHISEPTRLGMISYAVFCLKKKNKKSKKMTSP